jgi:hypothetical protein
VRTPALIVGIIFAVLAVASVLLRLAEIPGHSLLRIAGAGFFCLVALPLQLIYNLKRSNNALRRTADIAGTIGMFFVLSGLLFKVQNWAGAQVVLLGGLLITVIFVVLFIAASRQPGVITEWFTGYTATALIIIASLCVGWMKSSQNNEVFREQLLAYEICLDEYKSKQGRAYELILEKDTNGLPDHNDTMAVQLYEYANRALEYIEKVKANLVLESNEVIGKAGERKLIFNGGDTDVPTWYLIGDDITRPTGEGLYVFDAIREFRQDALAKTVNLAIPTPSGTEVQDQWVKDNFYHASVYEALTRLTYVQIAIQNSVITALEQDEYKTEE